MIEKEIVALQRIYEKNELTIDWFLGKRCNFDCSYCTPDIHDKSSPHIPLEDLKKIADSFLNNYNKKPLKIGFTGGEPVIHPEFHLFCQYLSEKNIEKITVTTNGSRTKEYYLDLFKYVKNMTFSQHFEFARNDIFLQKMKFLKENCPEKKNFIVQVMFHAKYFEEAKESISFYKKNNIRYTLRRIRQKRVDKKDSFDYNKEQLDWLFENQPESKTNANAVVYSKNNSDITSQEVNVNEISAAELNYFKGWTCWAGLDHIHINSDGNIYRGNCKQGGSIGSINNPGAVMPTKPVVCDLDRCFCAPEIAIKKIKNPDIHHLVFKN